MLEILSRRAQEEADPQLTISIYDTERNKKSKEQRASQVSGHYAGYLLSLSGKSCVDVMMCHCLVTGTCSTGGAAATSYPGTGLSGSLLSTSGRPGEADATAGSAGEGGVSA